VRALKQSGRFFELTKGAEMRSGTKGAGRFRGKVSAGLLISLVALLTGASSASGVSPQFVGLNWDGEQPTMESASDWNAIQHSGTKLFRLQGFWKIVNDKAIILGQNWNDPSGKPWEQTYDKYFQLAAERDITILPYLYGRQSGESEHRFYTSSEWSGWLEFVRFFVKRYGRGGTFWADHPSLPYKPVTTWEVWNEENLALNNPSLTKVQCDALGYTYNEDADAKTCVQPLIYASFFNAASDAITEAQNSVRKAGEPLDTKVLVGGLYEQAEKLVWTAEKYFGDIVAKNPSLNTKFKERNSGYGLHPYAFPEKEAEKLQGLKDVVTSTRTYLNTYDSSAKPIWVTEFGWTVQGEGLGAGEPQSTEAEQANLLTNSFNWLKEKSTEKNIEYAAWYNYKDNNSNPKWAYHCGLRTTSGVYRKSWFSFLTQTGAPYWPLKPGAFQANSGTLWTLAPSNEAVGLGFGMGTGTSPSIASFQSGYIVAFRANTGALWIYTPWGGGWTNGLQIAAGTNPVVAPLPNGSFQVVYQGTNGDLYTYTPEAGATDLKLGMAAGTSPAIVQYQSGYLVTFQSNTNSLWVYTPWGGAWSNGLQMAAGTNPSVAALPNGSFEVAYQGSSKNLYAYTPEMGAVDLKLGMAAGTSPALVR
jgi:Glycosyl hydrolase catalytic core